MPPAKPKGPTKSKATGEKTKKEEDAVMKDATPEPEGVKKNDTAAGSAVADAGKKEGEVKGEGEKEKDGEATAASASNTGGSAAAVGSGASGTSALLTGPEYDAAVARISEMGFPEDKVKAAMRAAFNNPDRAVEYLFSGIPEMPAEAPGAGIVPGVQASAGGARGGNRAATGGGGAVNTAGAGGDAASDTSNNDGPGTTPFNMFAPQPQTQRGGQRQGAGGGPRTANGMSGLRRALQSNPELLSSILSQLEDTDPALLQQLNAHPERLIQALNSGLPANEQSDASEIAELAGSIGGGGGLPEGAQVISVNEDERQQLERLKSLGEAMGLSQQSVLQTWLACDRNENLAANYMADHSQELRESQEDVTGGAGQDSGNQGQERNQNQDPNPPQS
eukprot:Plantae.Rhodophyta-Hildenbrandia_rubra.ctg13079.p1 GENE.Plantae.Rhodophyta-Hildenbrandia_rubra.ctg13079~~Plantae.Rhodophyta-Hildenbrandia_rubra.ctg13079.p1  ORF type:complete len:441 (-),score=129.90 Plantae.Rhodophyta-Hildenbrandia_rubra.ctg13079:1793-2971(-)